MKNTRISPRLLTLLVLSLIAAAGVAAEKPSAWFVARSQSVSSAEWRNGCGAENNDPEFEVVGRAASMKFALCCLVHDSHRATEPETKPTSVSFRQPGVNTRLEQQGPPIATWTAKWFSAT